MSFVGAEQARVLSQPASFGGPLIHRARVQWLRDAIAAGTLTPRMQQKWNTVLALPAQHAISRPAAVWSIPGNYSDDQATNAALLAQFRADAEPAVDYAWRYLVNANDSDARQVVLILNEYAKTPGFDTNAGSLLNGYNGWALLIQAALMIRACTRWRQLFDLSITSGVELQGAIRDDIPLHETYRMGKDQGNGTFGLLYYLAGMTVAAEYARINGEWLFDHVSPDGSSLRGWFEQQVHWTRNTTSLPSYGID